MTLQSAELEADLPVAEPPPQPPAGEQASAGPYVRLAKRYFANRVAAVALVVLLVVIVIAALAPLLAPFAPEQQDLSNRLASPNGTNWLGTDELGRDVLSRLLYASRTSLIAAVTAVSVAVVIGLPSGLAAGYFGRRVDQVLSRIADGLMCFPYLILAMAVIAAAGPGLRNAMVTIGVIFAPWLFRLVRAAVMEIRSSAYLEAATTCGTSSARTLTRHVLPNISSPLIVQLTVMLAAALLAEASLSFLGLGVTPPDASWGVMLGRAFTNIRTAPLGTVWPGLAIAITTLSLNVIGDGLRDALGRERAYPPRAERRKERQAS